MISIKINPRSKEVLVGIDSHLAKHQIAIHNALVETGKEVQTETRRLIKEGPKTGRIYTFRGRPHQASAPGEAPANRSGALAESVGFNVGGWNEMTVGESATYAKFLEDGTRKMAPRPHLIKAVLSNARNLENAIRENVKEAIG